MSTRAILGIVQKDGSFLGAWQWNDGGDKYLLEKLNKKFTDMENVKKLISMGEWKCMFGPRELQDYKKWVDEELTYSPFKMGIEYIESIESLNIHFLKSEHHKNKKPVVYKNIKDAAGQDINYLYIYFPALHKWKKYRSYDDSLKKDGLI